VARRNRCWRVGRINSCQEGWCRHVFWGVMTRPQGGGGVPISKTGGTVQVTGSTVRAPPHPPPAPHPATPRTSSPAPRAPAPCRPAPARPPRPLGDWPCLGDWPAGPQEPGHTTSQVWKGWQGIWGGPKRWQVTPFLSRLWGVKGGLFAALLDGLC
jgi:hypothetical protein